MRILVACEFSGIVRDSFIAKGHDAISCDLLPTERPGPHIRGDVRIVILNNLFDLYICHPPCDRLANSGVRWLEERNLWQDLAEACDFFNFFIQLGKAGRKVAIENPIQHGYARQKIEKYHQIIQPWMFGHGETKATCLWLYGLPKLIPTNIVEGREGRIWKMSPSSERSKIRSRTYEGVAAAMAEQWS